MKKRLLSFGMVLCMVLTLLPTTSFAEEYLEAPVCICKVACTAEAMNAECPVCGAEGASVENCGKYVAPAVEVPEPEPELTAVEKVQAMIDALPTVEKLENADDETVDTAYDAVQDAYDALEELSTEELDQITGLDKLTALLEWFTGPVSTYEGEDYSYLAYTEDNGTITITGLNDTSMTEVIIPASINNVPVTSIGDSAFQNCTSLTSITIPNSVTLIDGYAFDGCTSLTSITIPNGVTSIGFNAFQNCTSLTSITIPNGVTSIGYKVFYRCTSLTSITIPDSVTSIGDSAFAGCTSLTSITIPNGVTSIGDSAFAGCTSLTSITIPNGVTLINNNAFSGCTNLTSITVPNSVTRFGMYVFYYCSNLENIYYIGTEAEWNEIRGISYVPAKKVRYVGDIAQSVTFTPPGDPIYYDGNVKEATVTSNDSDLGDITIKYYDQNGEASPINVGTYTVKIDIAASEKYDAISGYEVGRFTILQAENSFTTDLSIENWTYGDTANNPTATAKFGTPTYSYSSEENGTYEDVPPTNAGTYWVKATVDETENYTGLEAKAQFTILPKIYTVTYAAGSNGIGTVAAGSKTHDVEFTLSSDTFTRAGYEQTGWAASDGGEKVYDLGGTYTANEDITLYPVWSDITDPTGEISIGIKKWTTLLDEIIFDLFFKDTQQVEITASDNSGDTVTIAYLLSNKKLTASELDKKTFDAYKGKFSIEPNNEWIIYAKLTDTTGNYCYINSEGIVLDNIAPVISGIENGKTYCAAQMAAVSDNYDVTVNVNDNPVSLTDGKFTLSPAEGTQTVVVTDKAGNVSDEMIVTVNDGHTYEWQSENGQYWKKCKYCDDETAKKDIPTITINGADAVCITQDYKFSFTLPEGATDAFYGYEFENKGDLGLPAIIENNEPHGVVSLEWYEPSENSFKVYAGAKTADGFEFFVSKTVALKSEHIDAAPKDHMCDICGATLSEHTGGEATCVSKAICDYCGEEYGEVDSTNHNLEKVTAKAATVTETGNIEYWQCKGCGDIFSDQEGKNKIELKDTVIAKNTATTTFTVNAKPAVGNVTKAPKTGDNSHMVLWLVLLFVSGGLLIITGIYGKKKKYNR